MNPELGVYPSVPFSTYTSWDAVNSSRLNKMTNGSPKHFERNLQESSSSLNLGRVYHSLVLTPENFSSEFLLQEKCFGQTAKGDRCKKAGQVVFEGHQFCKTHAPSAYLGSDNSTQIVPVSAWDTAHRMMEATLGFGLAADLLGDTQREIGYVWEEPTSGLVCKGLIDADNVDADAIIDLKSTRGVSPDEFKRSILKYGYHRQAAFYLNGASHVNRGRENFFWVAQESVGPFDCVVYKPTQEMLDDAAQTLFRWLNDIGNCVTNDKWPGFGEYGVIELDLPGWMKPRDEE